jgi:hypothetical protein
MLLRSLDILNTKQQCWPLNHDVSCSGRDEEGLILIHPVSVFGQNDVQFHCLINRLRVLFIGLLTNGKVYCCVSCFNSNHILHGRQVKSYNKFTLKSPSLSFSVNKERVEQIPNRHYVMFVVG